MTHEQATRRTLARMVRRILRDEPYDSASMAAAEAGAELARLGSRLDAIGRDVGPRADRAAAVVYRRHAEAFEGAASWRARKRAEHC